MIASMIDWTNVLVALIAGAPAILAAIFAGIVLLKVRTPSGQSLGALTDDSHVRAVANNLLLAKQNGPTVTADVAALKKEAEQPPQVPTYG